MSDFRVYVKLPDYLADWVRHDFWDDDKKCVVFPRNSAERTILELFLTKLPDGEAPVVAADGLTPIEVPTFQGKNPRSWCHLRPSAAQTMVSTIKRRFRKLLWDELHVIRREDVNITDVVYAFLEKYGIEPTEKNWETVRQTYKRLRDVYDKKG